MHKKIILIVLVLFSFKAVFGGNIPFVTTWKTDNTGASNNNQITIPTFLGETYNYTVEWGDGLTSLNVTGNITHTYATAGVYTVSITGVFPRIYFNVENDAQKLVSIDQWGDNEWSSMQNAFYGCENMQGTFSDIPNLVAVTTMEQIFREAKSFNWPIGNWNVGTVTNMEGAFQNATTFNQPIGNWDVANVTNMRNMFNNFITDETIKMTTTQVPGTTFSNTIREVVLTGVFNQNINDWDVSNVTNMSGMFIGTPFDSPINNWNVSKVTDMSYMFQVAANFSQDISLWDVGNVTNMSYMFSDALLFNQPIGNWNVSKVSNMRGLFSYAREFNQNINDWDISSLEDMGELFLSSTKFNQNMSGWEVGNVIFMDSAFQNTEFFNQDLSGWDVGNVVSMRTMFLGSLSFNQNLNVWNVSNVTDFAGMFAYAEKYNQPLNNWDVSKATDLSAMFGFAEVFNQDISGWNVANVEEMRFMFFDAFDFDQDLGSWNVSSLLTAIGMFTGVELSIENYDSLLIGWESMLVNNDVPFDGGLSEYCSGETARERLISLNNWQIEDGGKQGPELNVVTDQEADHSFTFLQITGTSLSGNQAYYTESGGQGIKYLEGETIYFSPTTNYPIRIFVYDESVIDSYSCSSEQSFLLSITETLPLCTTLIAPFQGAMEVSINATLEWESVFNANAYLLNVGTTPNGNDIVNAEEVEGNFYEFSEELPSAEEIYVTVIPFNSLENAIGCSYETFQTEANIQIPKFFTPNNDGFNDTWTLPNPFNSFDKAFIYDRFGKLLHQIISANNGWDGFFAGKAMPTDSYWYLVEYKTGEVFKGSFTLVK